MIDILLHAESVCKWVMSATDVTFDVEFLSVTRAVGKLERVVPDEIKVYQLLHHLVLR